MSTCMLGALIREHLLLIIAVTALVVLTPIIALRIYAYLTLGVCVSRMTMKGKTVIVTGANSGIGRETAKDMAKRGAKVIMACRNLETANEVRDEIVAATNNENVFVRQLDLSSFDSVRSFAAEINKSESKLDVLIHNAGMANTFGRKTNKEGVEITMATNQYGPFLLTHLLIDLLKRSAPSRIVVVASELYRMARLNLNNPNPVSSLPAYNYYVSKYANIVFTKELARKLEGSGVSANCLHPGLIDSGIWRNVPFPLTLPMHLIIKGFFKTAEQGAQTTIHLAACEELEGITGKYFIDCKERGLSRGAEDPAVAKKYWELSEELSGLKPTDPHL